MVKIARLLCALWVCGPLALEASAADSPARNGASEAAANTGQAAGSATPGRDMKLRAGRPVAQESAQAGSSKGDDSKGRNAASAASPRRGSVTPPHAAGSLARSNAKRLRSPHPAEAQGRITQTANGRVEPNAAAASRKLSARPPPTVKAMVRGSMIGGPRAAGPQRLGGPATGRTANNATISGTQLHHKL